MRHSRPWALFVVGASGHARELVSSVHALRALGEPVAIQGIVDDYWFDPVFEGVPVLGGIKQLGAFLEAHRDEQFAYITGTTDTRMRAELVRHVEELQAANLTTYTVRHPTAVVGEGVEIGVGACLAPGAVVTTQVTIGAHAVLDANCSVSRESVLARYVTVGLGASICSSVTIGQGCTVGAGATVVDGVRIGDWSVIGAGAVVVNDVPAHVTVAGAPARIVQRHGRSLRQTTLAG